MASTAKVGILMERLSDFCHLWFNRASWLWRHNHRIVLLFGICLTVACQDEADTPVIVTEIVEFEGEQLVITRVLTPTPVLPTSEPERLIEAEETAVELDVSVFENFGSLDPQRAANPATLDVIESLYVGLTNHNHITNAIEPELAVNWSVSPDGLTWTFNLRDDLFWVRPNAPSTSLLGDVEQISRVKVENLRPVVADDVVYAIQRACDPATRTDDTFLLFVIEGCRDVNALDEATPDDLAKIGVRALSDTQLTFTLTEPASYFLTLTSLPLMRPLPAEIVESAEVDWLDPEIRVSNGPFVLLDLTETQKNLVTANKPVGELLDLTILQRNPLWPVPYSGNVEAVNIYQYDNRQAAFDVWDDQYLDITLLPGQQVDAFLDPRNPRAVEETRQEAFYLGFNFDSPVFAIPEVRRAFSAAIDRELLIEEVYGRFGLQQRHFTPPGVLYGPPEDQVGVGYSPSYAQQQLVSSGFGSCRLLGEIRYLVSTSDIALQQAETLRDMWVDTLGCDPAQIVIEQVQFGTLLANTRRSAGPVRPDIYDLGWASFYPDANNWFYDVLHCEIDNRPNRPCSLEDELIRQASVVFSAEERTRLYRQIENEFFSDDGSYPVAPLYTRSDYLLTKTWIERFAPATFGGNQFDTILIDPDIKTLERSQ
jgi:oligopeptide transport system substrate-binding protein